jgi:hypothetical protein
MISVLPALARIPQTGANYPRTAAYAPAEKCRAARLLWAYLLMALQNPYLSVIGSQRHDKETILVDLNDRGRAEEAKAALS